MESIYLVGADDVRSVGNAMCSAADTMRSAVSSIDDSLDQHRRFPEDWLQRFESALASIKEPS